MLKIDNIKLYGILKSKLNVLQLEYSAQKSIAEENLSKQLIILKDKIVEYFVKEDFDPMEYENGEVILNNSDLTITLREVPKEYRLVLIIDDVITENITLSYQTPDDIVFFDTEIETEDNLLKDAMEKIIKEINEKIKFNETVKKSFYRYSFNDKEFNNPALLINGIFKK